MRKLKNVLRASSCCAFSILMCLPAAGQNAWSEADCVTLLDSTSVTVQPNGSGSFAVYKSFKVQTPKGAVNNHVIKYDYDPLTAFARFKQVTVQRANGETMQVDVTKTCDYAAPARAIYWGARQIMLELGRLEPGDVVSYEISKKGFTYALLAGAEDDDARFIPPMRGQFYDIVPFWVNEPTRRKVYVVSMPMEKELQFQFYNGQVNDLFYYYREQAALKARQYQRALDDIVKAVELSPKDLTYRAEHAVVNLRVGRYEESMKILNEILKDEPKYGEAYRLLGLCQIQLKKTDEACGNFNKAKELGDPNVDELIKKYCK